MQEGIGITNIYGPCWRRAKYPAPEPTSATTPPAPRIQGLNGFHRPLPSITFAFHDFQLSQRVDPLVGRTEKQEEQKAQRIARALDLRHPPVSPSILREQTRQVARDICT